MLGGRGRVLKLALKAFCRVDVNDRDEPARGREGGWCGGGIDYTAQADKRWDRCR